MVLSRYIQDTLPSPQLAWSTRSKQDPDGLESWHLGTIDPYVVYQPVGEHPVLVSNGSISSFEDLYPESRNEYDVLPYTLNASGRVSVSSDRALSADSPEIEPTMIPSCFIHWTYSSETPCAKISATSPIPTPASTSTTNLLSSLPVAFKPHTIFPSTFAPHSTHLAQTCAPILPSIHQNQDKTRLKLIGVNPPRSQPETPSDRKFPPSRVAAVPRATNCNQLEASEPAAPDLRKKARNLIEKRYRASLNSGFAALEQAISSSHGVCVADDQHASSSSSSSPHSHSHSLTSRPGTGTVHAQTADDYGEIGGKSRQKRAWKKSAVLSNALCYIGELQARNRSLTRKLDAMRLLLRQSDLSGYSTSSCWTRGSGFDAGGALAS